MLLALGGFALAAPALADVVALTGAAYAIWVMTRPVRLPWNLPERSGRKDPNELDTVRYKPTPAAGRDYLGNERFTRREIWRTREASNQHSTYPGATGSGKTGSMSSYAIGNALAQSSGATYVCAKGDKGVFEDAFIKAYEAGREDDVLLFSALGGESNTINQFADASANMIKETLVGLVNEPDPGSNGALFFGRMVAFIETIAPIARWIADNKGVRLDLERIRDLTELTNVVRMVQKREVKFVYAATGQEEIVDISGCPYLYIRGLESYLGETGSFDVDVSVKEQRSTAPAEQHSYVAMQLTEVFSQWLISLGHIFRVPSGDIDMADVVMQRRILVGLLPSLGSSEKTVSGLAKCLVAMLKAMMFHVLGHEIEGDYIEVNENKPSRAYAAYKVVRDEYAPQAAAGDDKMLAMSRSLNIEFLLGFQEIGSVRARMGEKASAVIGNPNTTFAMRLQDPKTGLLVEEIAGKAQVAHIAQREIANDISGGYRPPRHASMQSTNRINWLDLRDLKPGQAIIHYGNRRMHANCAFFKSGPPQDVRYNQLLMIERPNREEIRQHVDTLDRIRTALLTEPEMPSEAAPMCPALLQVLSTYAERLAAGVDPLRASLEAVLSCPTGQSGSDAGRGTPACAARTRKWRGQPGRHAGGHDALRHPAIGGRGQGGRRPVSGSRSPAKGVRTGHGKLHENRAARRRQGRGCKKGRPAGRGRLSAGEQAARPGKAGRDFDGQAGARRSTR